MKKLLFILFCIGLLFSSCDGRKSNRQSLSDSIDTFKKTNTFKEDLYIPEDYIEHTTDTILSNDYTVKIRTYADMNSNNLRSVKKDHITYNYYHRNIKSQIQIKKHSTTIFNTILDKAFILSNTKTTKDILESSTLQGAWVNQKLSLNNDKVVIDISYIEPKTKEQLIYQLSVNTDGMLINPIKENYYL